MDVLNRKDDKGKYDENGEDDKSASPLATLTMQNVGDQTLQDSATVADPDGKISGISISVQTFTDANTAAPTFVELTDATIGEIEYYKQGSDAKLDEAPTEAGTYTAKVTIGDATTSATASVDYRIFKRFHSPVLKSPVKNESYDFASTTEQDLITVEEDAIKKVDRTDDSTFAFALGENATTIPTTGWSKDIPKGTGTGPFYVFYRVAGDKNHGDAMASEFPNSTGYAYTDDSTSTWESKNYKPAFSVIVISKDFTDPPTGKKLTYNTTEQKLVNEGIAASGSTMQYALGTDDTTVPTGNWSEEVPKKTDAGTYYVWYKTVSNDNTSSTPICIPVTIDKAYPTANAPTGLTATYGQTLANVSLEGKNPEGNTEGTWAWDNSNTEVGNAGEHNFLAKFTPTDAVNYHSDLQASVTVTVSKASAPEITAPTLDAVTYDPTKKLADVTLSGGWTWVTNTTVPTVGNSGYDAALTVDDANYNYTGVDGYSADTHKVTRTVALTVNKAEVTAPAINSKVYNGEAQTADVAADTLYTVTTNVGGTNVGDYNVVLTLQDSTNYKWTDSEEATKTLTFQITKATAPAVTVPTLEAVTYDPANTLANVALTDGWAWVTETTTVPTVGNSDYQAALTVDDTNYDYTGVEGHNAETHNVTRTVSLTVNKAGNPLTYSETQTVTKTFSTSSQTAPLETATKAEGTLTYAITSQKNGSNADVSYFTLNGTTLTLTENTPAGTYTVVVTATAAGNGNYNSGSQESTVTVTVDKAANPATVTNTATVIRGGNTVDLAGNVTLNGATGEVSYAIDGAANGCTLSGSVLTSSSSTGSVIVNVTVTPDDNYNALAATPITVTISDKGIQSIEADNVTATYGDTGKSVSASVTVPATGSGAISYAVKSGSGDYIDVDSTSGALTIKKAGTATVTVTAAETLTYAAATMDVTVEISKATPSYTVPTGLTATYGQTLADVTLPSVDGGAWSWKESSTSVGDVGANTFPATFTPTDTANYNTVSDIDITVTVGKAAATVTTAPAEIPGLTYTADDHTLVNAGTANGGTMQYALGTDNTTAPETGFADTIPAGKNAGTYYVWYKVAGDSNHSDSEAACVSVTVAKATMTPPTLRLVTVTKGQDGALTYTNKTEWIYGDTSVVPLVEGNDSGGVVTAIYTVNDKEQTEAPTDAGSYTVKAKIAATANYNAIETNSVPFTITKAPHSDMTAAQTVSVSRSGVTGATLNLSEYLADATNWSVKSTDGTLITSATKGDGAVLTYTAAQTTAASATGNVVLTVTTKNYADYTLAVNFRTATAFTLRFESNGGTEIPSRILNENAAYGSLPTAEQVKRTGYTFGGWFTDAALTVSATAQTSIGSSDATVYAKWSVDSHTITLNLNERGTLDKTAITYSAADSDFNLPVPADVTDGSSTWTFGGWQKGGTGAAQINVTIQTAALEDATYTALWVEGKKEGEVTFTKDASADTGLMGLESMDEGTVSTEDAGSGTPAQTLADVMKEVACAENKAGEADKTVTVAMDVQPVNTNSSGLAPETKTAIEKIKEQSGSGSDNKVKDDVLTIEVQKTTAPTSGSGEVTTEKLTDIGRVVEIPLQYNMTGRYQPRIFRFHDNVAAAFARLATRPVSGFRDGTYFVSGVGASAVIYIYTEKFSTYSITTTETPTHTVMFETNGGTAIESVSVEDQMTLTQPTTPTKDSGDTMISYVFDGWYSNSDFSTVYDFSTKVTKDLTLYAKWREVIIYTITFNPNGGTVTPTSAKTDESGKVSLPTPAQSGYRFDGWYDALTEGNMITAETVFTANAVVYARWTKISSGSSRSGGGSSGTSYAPSVSNPSNGTVSVSPTSPKSGDKVTITAKPDAGYEVDTVTVTNASGKTVSVTKVNDTAYTFTQPSSKVKIDVTFKETSTTDALAKFSDVNASDWYADAVCWALDNGVMNGVSPKYFNPNGDTSRAMVATMLWRLEGSPVVSGDTNFVDVTDGTWFADAVRWANANGIVTGYRDANGRGKVFNNDGAVTREQLATMLYRYAQYKKADVSVGEDTNILSYNDAQTVSGWAASAMQWAVGSGIINGVGSDLVPAGNATRAQVATMLMRYSTAK